MILYPAVDIRGGRAVRLLRGDYDRETVYEDDPAAAAARWAGQGARFLHVVDLDGARSGRPANLDAVAQIVASAPCPVQVGGGLRDLGALEAALEAGARRVVIGTAALRDPGFLDAALERHGDAVVVSVDARAGRVALSGWTEVGDTAATDAVAALSGRGVPRFLFTPIEVDGTMDGPGLDQLASVAAATEAAVIYSGGVGEIDDLHALAGSAPSNVEGAVVGRALYEGRFTVAEGQAALERGAGGA
ncbi:MAG: 1-(5-phosphoribosyl)-5-[(5-phosphoribosylamino)methylideneamino]imidazole-4-carboxamide isomerase [Solirubrobacterales bacterium]